MLASERAEWEGVILIARGGRTCSASMMSVRTHRMHCRYSLSSILSTSLRNTVIVGSESTCTLMLFLTHSRQWSRDKGRIMLIEH
jgi:hypothetical protein